MATRTVNISLLEQTPQVRTLRFVPRLASVDGDVLLKKAYVVTTNSSGDATIALPVKASGSLRYDYEIPRDGGKSIGHFFLSAGSAIDLDDLIAAGGVATDSVADYIESKISDAAYDATAWNGVTGVAPSKNAVRDKLVLIDAGTAALASGVFSYVNAPLITSDKHNFAPGGDPHVIMLRSDGTGEHTMTGLLFDGDAPQLGERKLLHNAGAFPLILAHNGAASGVGRRFYSPDAVTDYRLDPQCSVEVKYAEIYIGSGFYYWMLPTPTLKPADIGNSVCGLNENAVVPADQLGQVLENHSIKYRKFENYEPISVSVGSWFGLDLDKIDDRCGHFAITGFDGDYALITSISNGEWDFEHGDTIVVQNRMITPVILRQMNVADHGYALEFAWEFEEMVVPAGCAFIARYDNNKGRFDVTPLWTPIEDRYSAAPATIHAENYHDYHGRTIYVQGGDDVIIDNVPHGFNATFIQLGAGDVEFLITDPYLTLQNRQGHTKIAGEFGVVGVKVDRNNDFLLLFGDTKA